MSKTKNNHFDEISFQIEKARVIKYLNTCGLIDFSPVLLTKALYGKFNLSKEELVYIVREYYNF